jgi:hypothetical protein
MGKLGYDDTPKIPNQQWLVHDDKRPQPRVVTPGDRPGAAPSDAIVLFDGTDLSGWLNRDGVAAEWNLQEDYMEVLPGSGDIQTKENLPDGQLHLEWAAPEAIKGESQGRGNSGVFLMGEYEIQVLDCFKNPTYADGTNGAIYGQWPPLVNACRPPGEWQTYDIIWISPKFAGDKLLSPARVTVVQNGVLLHHNKEWNGPSGHRNVPEYEAHAPEGPLKLQDHGDLVRFRNIWHRPLTPYS